MSEPKFKVGDMAFSFQSGFRVVQEAISNCHPLIIVHGAYYYRFDGRMGVDDFAPSLLTVEEAAKLGYFPPKAKKKIKLREALFGAPSKGQYWIRMSSYESEPDDPYFIKWIEGGREIEVSIDE